MLRIRKASHQETKLPGLYFEGFRVYLRPPILSDWQDWVRVRAQNYTQLQPFEPLWPKDYQSKTYFEQRLKRQAYAWRHDRAQAFLIFEKQHDTPIGGININNICRGTAQYASLGYWLDLGHQGQGFMQESLQLILRYGFTDLALNRFHASCLLHNERSKNLLKRAGFSKEGIARRYLKINGTWQDHLLFGLVRDDWQIRRKA